MILAKGALVACIYVLLFRAGDIVHREPMEIKGRILDFKGSYLVVDFAEEIGKMGVRTQDNTEVKLIHENMCILVTEDK